MEQKSRKITITNIILILIFLIGMGVLLYPNISDMINRKNSSKAIASYNEELAQMNSEKKQEILTEAEQYNYDLMQNPGRFSATDESHKEYMSELNIDGNGMMGYLKIPKLNVDVPIQHTVTESVLQNNVGHVEGSSLPIGGLGTHSVLSAHTGLPGAVLFTYLEKLVEGDVFYIYIMGVEHKYVVDKISIVLPNDTSELYIDPNMDYVTLITCTPYGENTHRLLVRGERVNDEDDADSSSGGNKIKRIIWTRERAVSAIATGLGIAFIGMLFFLLPARIKKYGLRPWDETILDVINASIIISEKATRENWEAYYVANEADWLANLRKWDENILKPLPLSDKDFDSIDIDGTEFDNVDIHTDDLEHLNVVMDTLDKPEGVNSEYVLNSTDILERNWDDTMEEEKDEDYRDWDDDILSKVTQNWKQINAETYREAINYIDIDKVVKNKRGGV